MRDLALALSHTYEDSAADIMFNLSHMEWELKESEELK